MQIPILRTSRLTLRGPAADDFAAYRDFYSDAAASAFYGGPLAPEQAWRKLAVDVGHWALRGFGMWSIVVSETGAMVGGCGLVWPEGWPGHELTWWIAPSARRQGYALEASRAALRWGYDVLWWPVVGTHMDDDNAAARALAEKLGGRVIARQTFPDSLARNIYALPRPDSD